MEVFYKVISIMESKEIVSNRRAYHDYEILETLEAGVILQGTEIKSLRDNGGSLQESYIKIINDTPLLLGATIAPYRFGNIYNHQEKRDRVLLLHKKEIARLRALTQEKGLTLIALSMYLKKGRVKIKVGVARGKKLVDKRASIKERDEKRTMQRAMKGSLD
jgi:SsrA-binding protein